jgi:hypothetical protein
MTTTPRLICSIANCGGSLWRLKTGGREPFIRMGGHIEAHFSRVSHTLDSALAMGVAVACLGRIVQAIKRFATNATKNIISAIPTDIRRAALNSRLSRAIASKRFIRFPIFES